MRATTASTCMPGCASPPTSGIVWNGSGRKAAAIPIRSCRRTRRCLGRDEPPPADNHHWGRAPRAPGGLPALRAGAPFGLDDRLSCRYDPAHRASRTSILSLSTFFMFMNNSSRYALPAGQRPGERSALRGCLLALFALCAVAFWIRAAHIAATLPYPQHIDEVHIAQSAANILTTGNYHPGTFNYPSLPKYLAVAAMSVGFISAAPELRLEESPIDIRDNLGSVSFPFYTLPGVVEKARWLFALLSVVAVAASGVVAYQLLGRPGALILAPLVLALSYYFFFLSHSYLNVDIVGTCFVALGMAAVLQGATSSSRPSPAPTSPWQKCVSLSRLFKWLGDERLGR